jgi:hypothetical protein
MTKLPGAMGTSFMPMEFVMGSAAWSEEANSSRTMS